MTLLCACCVRVVCGAMEAELVSAGDGGGDSDQEMDEVERNKLKVEQERFERLLKIALLYGLVTPVENTEVVIVNEQWEIAFWTRIQLELTRKPREVSDFILCYVDM